MGEMADHFLEQVENQECLFLEYMHGRITDLEAYDAGLVDSDGSITGPSTSKPKSVTCRCCGQVGLRWEQVKTKWRLFDGDKLHVCPVNPFGRRMRQ